MLAILKKEVGGPFEKGRVARKKQSRSDHSGGGQKSIQYRGAFGSSNLEPGEGKRSQKTVGRRSGEQGSSKVP